MAYALIDKGQTSIGHFGHTAKDNGQPVDDQTAFVIGSVSKSFTAVAIMQLKEKGALKLDDSVSEYLPEFKGSTAADITIRQLLSHTSGFSMAQGNQNQADLTIDKDALNRRVFVLTDVKLATTPGEKWAYSNANYQLLSRVVEILSDQEFGDYIEDQIMKPLGMDDSRMIDWKAGGKDAVGHRPMFWTKMRYDGRGAGRGSLVQGGVMSSARDMARYLAMMMNGQDDIISTASKAEMMKPASDVSPRYGLGWFVAPEQGFVFHSGANPGFEALATMRPEKKQAFVILANGGSGLAFGDTGYLRRGATVLAIGGPKEKRPGIMMKVVFVILAVLPLFVSGCRCYLLRYWPTCFWFLYQLHSVPIFRRPHFFSLMSADC